MPVKGVGVIYLQRDKFQIYTTLQQAVLEFRFVPEIVRDLDIVNIELFENVLKMFILGNKIPQSNLIIALADNVCFIKDIPIPAKPAPSPDQNQADIKEAENEAKKELSGHEEEFLDHVPFENVASKTYPLQNSERVFAVNQELYEAIKSSFEEQGFTIDLVLPAELCGNNLGIQPVLTPPAANLIMQLAPTIKQYNFLNQSIREPEKTEHEIELEESDNSQSQQPKNDHKREILLSAVFGILVIVLIVVYFMSNSKPAPIQSNASQPVSTVQSIP